MNPTLLYNNYHLQRRKMYDHNPRSNLYSTVDFTWKDSLQKEGKAVSPRAMMLRRREVEREEIKERADSLIEKRLRRELGIDTEQWGATGKRYVESDKMYKVNGVENSKEEEFERMRGKSLQMISRRDSHTHGNNNINSNSNTNYSNPHHHTNNQYDSLTYQLQHHHSNPKASNTISIPTSSLHPSPLTTHRQSTTQNYLLNPIPSKNPPSNYLANYLERKLNRYMPAMGTE